MENFPSILCFPLFVTAKHVLQDVLSNITSYLSQIPAVNSSWMDSFIRQYTHADICVAVATDNGKSFYFAIAFLILFAS